jgi:hypothetical protein
MNPRYTAMLLFMAALIPAAALASGLQVAGIEIAEQARVADGKLFLNGTGVRRLFGFRVYVAALYLPEPARSASQILEHDQPRRLQITLLRDTSAEQNLGALKGGLIDNNSEAELDAIQNEINRFLAALHQVHEVPTGTVIQIDYQPGKGTRTRVGDHDLGLVPGERFNRALLKIWLGDKPIQHSLKQSLLGLEGPTL